jgi:hypothetical protein
MTANIELEQQDINFYDNLLNFDDELTETSVSNPLITSISDEDVTIDYIRGYISEYIKINIFNLKDYDIIRSKILMTVDLSEQEQIIKEFKLSQNPILLDKCHRTASMKEYSDGLIAYELDRRNDPELIKDTEKSIRFRTCHYLFQEFNRMEYAQYFVLYNYKLNEII